MTNVLTITIFILGFVLILKGAEFLVDSAVLLAGKAKIPPIIVGATIVAIATTFPETIVSLVSSANGKEALGVSTAVGAMVCNFTIVLGVAFLFLPTKIAPESFISKALYFIFAVLSLFFAAVDGRVSIFDAIILILVLVLFIVLNCVEAGRSDQTKTFKECKKSWVKIIVEFIISALSISLGAIVLVENVDAVGAMLGINGTALSFVVIAIGTNIPELVTTLTSVHMKNPEIGVGNIFGASIIDCTLLIAGSVFANSSGALTISRNLIWISLPMLLLITGLISIPIIKNGRSSRLQGLALLFTYILYTVLVLWLT